MEKNEACAHEWTYLLDIIRNGFGAFYAHHVRQCRTCGYLAQQGADGSWQELVRPEVAA